MNYCLLSKWWWKLENENGIWQDIVKKKHLQNISVAEVKHKNSDSPCWFDLLKVKDLYIAGRKIKIGVGNIARFWEDRWLYERPLADCYPELYSICHDQQFNIFLCNTVVRSNGSYLSGYGYLNLYSNNGT
jgi:hypothetical protein